jgi:outer membrane protein assembly factor BamE
LNLLTGFIAVAGRALLMVAACLALASCFLKPHRIDVQQGNFIEPEAIAKLKPGMTRSQVRFLLGSPLLVDAFHPDRWDYLYIDRRAGRLLQEHRLTLWFDGDALKRAVTDTPEVAPDVGTAAAPAKPNAAAADGKQSAARTP